MRTVLIVLLTLALNVTSAYADDFQDGIDAHKRGDYETAFEKLKPVAEQGQVDAQYTLGLMYDGVIQDYKEAV